MSLFHLRIASKFAILFEAGTAVRNMDSMRKDMQEYTKLIEDIKDAEFESAGVRAEMLSGYKGSKKVLTGLSLQQKLKADSTELKKLSYEGSSFMVVDARVLQVYAYMFCPHGKPKSFNEPSNASTWIYS